MTGPSSIPLSFSFHLSPVHALVGALAALSMQFGCSSPDPPMGSGDRVLLLAAASTADAIEAVAREFRLEYPEVQVQVSTGPSNLLARQILSGAAADIFLSANREWATTVTSDGAQAESVDLLSNRLVLIVPQENEADVSGLADLASESVRYVAIANPDVPAGDYAQQSLSRHQLLLPLSQQQKLVRGQDVRVTLAYVERGEADAGIVYASDAKTSSRVRVVAEINAQDHGPIVYPAILLHTENSSARRFFHYLQTDRAKSIFESYGFVSLNPVNPISYPQSQSQ